MRSFRTLVPILGIVALVAMFFKLPETPSFFDCKECVRSLTPFLPLFGAGYFATITAVALFFPAFPSPLVARSGLTWSILFAFFMTFFNLPIYCVDCLVAHSCNIGIWTIWLATHPVSGHSTTSVRERLFLTIYAPISIVALYSCLNLSFLAYGYRQPTGALKSGDRAPSFTATTSKGVVTLPSPDYAAKIVLNFISPGCVSCKEQLAVLGSIIDQLHLNPCRIINVSPDLTAELTQMTPQFEWLHDPGNKLLHLFKVTGTPTMVAIDAEGKVTHTIPGIPLLGNK